MSADLIARLAGLIVFGLIGWQLGTRWAGPPPLDPDASQMVTTLTLAGATLGALLGPHLTTRPAMAARRFIRHTPAAQLVAAAAGLGAGLLVAALASVPLGRLPAPVGQVAPLVAAIVFGYLGILMMVLRQQDILGMFDGRQASAAAPAAAPLLPALLLDTSVIIDGRMADICETGFIRGRIAVPRFVLVELQVLADSSDPLKRARGRRGLDILNRMQQASKAPVSIEDMDVEGAQGVDEKLIRAARKLNYPLVTNDYNLNRVAVLQGIEVLNINELANAVKTVLLPGESLRVRIIQEGKEAGQGIAYLDDGTMIVVENGRRQMHQTVDVSVTKVLQTSAGRMVFAQLNGRT